MFDLFQTRVLHAQLSVPVAERDASWNEAFFPAAWHASVKLGEPPITTGSDGFSYLRLDVPATGSFEANCLAHLAQYAIDNTAGAAFYTSPDATTPAYLMSLGQLYSLLRYDSWEGDPLDVEETRRGPRPNRPDVELDGAGGEKITFEQSHEIMLGAPSPDFLPSALAAGLYRHLTLGWGVTDPQVGVLFDPELAPSRALLLDCKEAGAPDPALSTAHLRVLQWYLPPARSLMLLPREWSATHMVPLAGYADRTQAD